MGAPKRIVVIEDADDVRLMLQKQLGHLGFQTRGASNGLEGLEVIDAEPPDLILCDLRMPKLDGLGVLSALKGRHPGIPVIVVSGEGVLHDAVEALRLGAWDYITKPIAGMAVLQHAVGKALEKAELIRQNKVQTERVEALLAELKDDLEAGRRLQQQLLPAEGARFGSFTLTRALLPSVALSGDFLDAFSLGAQRWAFFLADVAGHGVPSALVTVMLRTLVQRKVATARDSAELAPARFLESLNGDLLAQGHEKHVAFFYGVVDEKAGTLTCANAGCFPWPILVQGGVAHRIELPGMPLGLMPKASWEQKQYTLAADARLVCFSDGIADVLPGTQLDEKQAALGELSLKAKTAGELMAALDATGARARLDDVAVMVLQRGAA